MCAGTSRLGSICLASALVIGLASTSIGSVTGYYYSASVSVSAQVQGNGIGGIYAYTEHYEDQDSDVVSGAAPVSAQVEAAAGPDGYVWIPGEYPEYPRATSAAQANSLGLNIDCYGNHGAVGDDMRCSVNAYAEASAEARFEIAETDSWVLSLSGWGSGPWVSGDISASLFDANLSLVQEWGKTWYFADHAFMLSATDTFSSGTYYLYLTAWGSALSTNSEADSADVWIKACVTPIPAPGAIPLVGLGLCLLRLLRPSHRATEGPVQRRSISRETMPATI
jgi:hypothetical protein